MSRVSHDHPEAWSVFHLSSPSLKSHISTFAYAGFAPYPPGRVGICSNMRPAGRGWTRGSGGGRQERSSCEPRSSQQIEGDEGRLVNRHRCTDLSRTVCGRKRKVTLSRREGGDKVNNTCCVTEVSGRSQMTMILPGPDLFF